MKKTKSSVATMPLTVVYRKVSELKPDPKNARRHPPEQIKHLRASIREFGITKPILLKPGDIIGAGNGIFEAAKAEGIKELPTITLAGLSEKQWRAYAIADNKHALNSDWNLDMLGSELGALGDFGFDLGKLGFADWELAEQKFELDIAPPSVQDNAAHLADIRSQRKRGNAEMVNKNDTEHYLIVVFASRGEREAALKSLGLPSDERYVVSSSIILRPTITGAKVPKAARKTKAAQKNKAGAAG